MLKQCPDDRSRPDDEARRGRQYDEHERPDRRRQRLLEPFAVASYDLRGKSRQDRLRQRHGEDTGGHGAGAKEGQTQMVVGVTEELKEIIK